MTDVVNQEPVALCLSGGGFRASIFHLGALTRLNELGVLSQIDVISSVSGGSILSGFLAALLQKQEISWPISGKAIPDWDEKVIKAFIPFVRTDIRTGAFLAGLIPGISNSEQLAKSYNKFYRSSVQKDIKLSEIPLLPKFKFCSTNLFHGNNWVSTCVETPNGRKKAVVGDYKTGQQDGADWTLGYAVATSSCFPPVFSPLQPMLSNTVDEDVRKFTRLSDGGLYDNLGLEPVWKRIPRVLVSDGGAPLNPEHKSGVKKLLRYNSVILNQVGALRTRWLVDRYIQGTLKGTYWGIGTAVSDYELVGPPYGFDKEITKWRLASIRTDLDPFSSNEIAILMKHGYEIADAAIHRHQPELKTIDLPRRTWPASWYGAEMAKIIETLNSADGRTYVRIPLITKRHKRADLVNDLDQGTLLPAV